ncbi:hypothetical protein DVH24_000253 [Malus domestica]|uniref:Uncharacterized protein n=1 Tax=Malus domestica TaxID=3750 RepID=A0A498J2W0_MALDO|nr:hypothetical protein DVH24_000253 [Malus domestica]
MPTVGLEPTTTRYRLVCKWDRTGQDGTERRGSKDTLGWKQGGRRRRRRGYNFVFHGYETSHSRGVRWNKNSPKIHPMEQRVPPILGAPNNEATELPTHVVHMLPFNKNLDGMNEKLTAGGKSAKKISLSP